MARAPDRRISSRTSRRSSTSDAPPADAAHRRPGPADPPVPVAAGRPGRRRPRARSRVRDAATALRLGVAMVALQALDRHPQRPRRRPPRRRPEARQADPGRARQRRGRAWRSSRLAAGLGVLLALALGPGDWPPGASSSWRSGMATTCLRRARPGRGCRSRSGSRCCRSTAGSARPGTLPGAFARPGPGGDRSAARPWPSPMPGRTWSGTSPAGSAFGRRAPRARRAARGASTRRCWRCVVVAHRVADPGRQRGAGRRRWSVPLGRGRWSCARRRRHRAWRARRRRSRALPGSSRPSACAACWRARGWLAGVAAIARLMARPRSVAGVVAPDEGDRVLQLELGDRQVLREVGAVGRRDRLTDARGCRRTPTSSSTASARCLLGIDERVVRDRRIGLAAAVDQRCRVVLGRGSPSARASAIDRRGLDRTRRTRRRRIGRARRPSILSRSLMRVSSPRAT